MDNYSHEHIVMSIMVPFFILSFIFGIARLYFEVACGEVLNKEVACTDGGIDSLKSARISFIKNVKGK
jgi:hypothetical protein